MAEEVAENIYLIAAEGYSSNAYLLAGKKPALIDPGLHENQENILTSLSALDLAPKDINLILLTHGHADHWGACSVFPNAEVMASPFDGKHINGKDAAFTAADLFPDQPWPTVTFFAESQVIDVDPFILRVIPSPGHTAGSVCFLERAKKILFSGDTLFNGACGRHDLESGDLSALKSSLNKLLEMDFELLLPGHNGIRETAQKENISQILASLGKNQFL